MEKVKLWTRQNRKILDILENEGVFYSKKEYIVQKNDTLSPYYIELYDWFVDHASEIVDKPKNAQYPIWCSVSNEYMLRGVQGDVLIELEVDRDRIVYFDAQRWDLVLNHTYVAKDQKDAADFAQRIKSRGIKNSFSFLGDYYQRFYPDLVKEVMESWARVFDIDPEKADIFSLQANIWEIRSEDIVSITEYREVE